MITLLLADNQSMREISQALGRSPSTISRELQRKASPEYRLYLSHRAESRAATRRKGASRRPRLKQSPILAYVHAKLAVGWSPEQIAGRIGIDHPGLTISHEAIYQYIYHPQTEGRPELIRCLRRAHRRRKPHGLGRRERKTKIPSRVPIDCRPVAVEQRRQFGHWEGDSLVSQEPRRPQHAGGAKDPSAVAHSA
jgi:IS30 family transposase